MGRQSFRWRRWLALALLLALLVLNGVAWMQAWAMTHYAPAGTRTPKPEDLTFAEKIGTIFTGVTVTRPRNEHSPADSGLRYETRTIPVGQASGALEAWYVPSD